MLDYLIVFKVTKPRRFQNLFEILKNYILCQFVVSMCPLLTVYKVIEVSRRQGKGMKLLVIYIFNSPDHPQCKIKKYLCQAAFVCV